MNLGSISCLLENLLLLDKLSKIGFCFAKLIVYWFILVRLGSNYTADVQVIINGFDTFYSKKR